VICPLAVENALFKVPLIIATISPVVPALSVLFAVCEITLVFRVVAGPGLDSIPVLTFLTPVSLIAIALQVGELSKSVGFVVNPSPDIAISVGVDKPALAVTSSQNPRAFIGYTACILHYANAIPHEQCWQLVLLVLLENRWLSLSAVRVFVDSHHLAFVEISILELIPKSVLIKSIFT
jgi:hypothetical protein